MLPSSVIGTHKALHTRPWRSVLCALGAGAALVCGPAAARAADASLLFHGDLDGNLALPACGRGGPAPPDYAALVALVARERQQAAAAGAPAPLALLGGNVATPGLFGRDLLERGGRPGVAALAALLARAGYEAVALGHHDLAGERERLLALVASLRARGTPVLASNLTCDELRRALCSALRPELVIEGGGDRTAVLALLSPSLLPGVPPAAREGLGLEPMHDAAVRLISRVRAHGATRVVLMVDVPRSWDGAQEVAALQQRFARGPAPDVILSSGLAGRGPLGTIRLLEQDGAPPVIGSTAASAGIARVRLPASGKPQVEVLRSGAERDPATAALLAPLADEYCRRHGVVVGAGPVRGELTREKWLGYLLAVMRRHAHAEVALLNRDFVKSEPFPFRGRLTRIDLLRAMPYEGVVGTARVPGARLAALLSPAMGDPRLVTLGVDGGRAGKPLAINGRPLDPTRSYRVATIAFVAAGGDELLSAGALPFRPLPGAPDLRRLVEHFLETGTATDDGDPAIDPRTDFGRAAAEKTLVVAMGDLAVDLSQTSISRQPGQQAPQLTRAEQRSIKGELTAGGQLRSRLHEGDARLKLVYGHARNQPADEPRVSAETADLLTFSALYDFRGLRNLELPVPRAAVPDPYARLLVESELTRPAVSATQTRDYHHAELTATTGALFTVTPKLRLRAGVGVRKQLVAPAPAGRARALVEAGGTLDPIPLFTFGGVAARFEAVFDYVFADPFAAREHQLKANGRVAVPILPLLFVTAGLDLFAVQQGGGGWGAAYDTSIGLRLHLDAARQSL